MSSSASFENKSIDHIISKRDILKITIKTQNPETLTSISENISNTPLNQNRETLIYNSGYKLDNEGFINYPLLGKIKAINFTVAELSDLLTRELTNLDFFTEPIVDIKVLNMNFTVLGEVNKPGKYYFDSQINVLQALGMAGDLTINGKRTDIKLIRNSNEKSDVFSVDLTKSEFISSPSFNVVSGDVIIVNPNTNRVKNAGIIGNSGTLLSLLSFLLSSIIIINR